MMRRGSFRAFWLIFLSGLVLSGILLTSCARSPYSLDQGRAVEKTISAKKGGEISLKTASGERVNLAVPQQALKKDTTIVATPLTEAPLSNQKDVLVKGVLLEEKGKEGKSLNFKFPVLLSFTVKGTLPEEATIVKYLPEKKSYEVIPTEITAKGKETTLTAELMSLSGYGSKKGSEREIRRARERKRKLELVLCWRIKAKNTVKQDFGGIPVDYTLTLELANYSIPIKIPGYYGGDASLEAKGKAVFEEGVGAGVDAKLEGSALINVKEHGKDFYRGAGTLNLKPKGEIKAWGPGIVERGELFPGREEEMEIEVTIKGTEVTITIVRSHPLFAGGLVFKGTLVGPKKR
jgi:hypothetical protein